MNLFDLITSADFAILNFIQDFIRCDFLDAVMPFLSFIGEHGLIWIIAFVPMLFFRKTRSWGIIMILSMGLAFFIGEIFIKNVVCRVRPCYFADIEMLVEMPNSYSFPSGHSSSSFAAATALFIMNKKTGVCAYVLAFLIAFSRLYNYVHFPSDVICGIILGILSALLIYFIFKKLGLKDKIDRLGIREM